MMSKSTVTTSLDAVVRVVEDVTVVVGTGVATWTATHSVNDVLTAVGAAPLVRSGLAGALSGGRVSGLVSALKIVRKALALADSTAATIQADIPKVVAAVAPVITEARNPNSTV